MKKYYFVLALFFIQSILSLIPSTSSLSCNLGGSAFGQRLSAGYTHSLLICGNTNATACGNNAQGQLGDGTFSPIANTSPVKVIDPSNIKAIAGGKFHTLILKNDSTVWSCGDNIYGQLGDGTTIGKFSPVKINGLSGIIAIAGGENHSVFLKKDGTVWACGLNKNGELGDGTNTDKTTPIQVIGLTGIIAIAAGDSHSLFLKNDGTVWSCGYNNKGQLGDWSTNNRNSPVQVNGLTNIISIDGGGAHSLFLKNDSTVWSSGYNGYAQLGDGSFIDRTKPVLVTGLTSIKAIACGTYHSIFLKNDGTVYTCGKNGYGQLGDGSFNSLSTPTKVINLTNITAIAGGVGHTLFLKNDSTVWACGADYSGQLGDGVQTGNQKSPVIINGSKGTIAITAEDTHSLFLKNDYSLWACGENTYGQFGDGISTQRYTFNTISGLSVVTDVSAGQLFSLFLKKDSTVWSTGDNQYGQLGDGTNINKNIPVQITSLSGIIAISTGQSHSLFLKSDGTVWSCGYNYFGQLGIGTTTDKTTPVQVTGLTNIVAINAGSSFSLFLKGDGTVWACGVNNYRQLGDGTNSQRNTPIKINGLSNIIAISAGQNHSLFLKNDNTLWACGGNNYGQLADGTTNMAPTPFKISTISGISAIEAGRDYSLLLKSDGAVWSCGKNDYGKQGDGTITDKPSPVKINGVDDVTVISAGDWHSMFLKNDGSVWTCGYNISGQLGDGTHIDKYSPVQQISTCPPANPIAIFTTSKTSVCEGNCLSFKNKSNWATSWNWSFPGSDSASSTTKNPSGICYNTAGTYTVSLIASNAVGADTTQTIINVNKASVPVNKNVTACGSYTSPSGKYKWIANGTFNDTILNTVGCDSLMVFNLTIKNTTNTITATSCGTYTSPSTKYKWSVSGTYKDTIPNVNGCDSILTVDLKINNSVGSISANACNSYVSPSTKYTWISSGTYKDTIPNAVGCDSLITINLSINKSSKTITKSACYTYISPSGKTFSSTGTYNDTIQNVKGCDSLITIKLTINVNTNSNIILTACDTYTSPSQKYIWKTSGTFYDTIKNNNGCDSLIVFNLTILNSVYTSQSSTIYANQSFAVGSKNHSATNTYIDTLKAYNGCDSIVTTNLTVMANKSDDSNDWKLIYPMPTSNNLYSIKFITDKSAFAIGDAGVLLKTIDKGESWNSQIINTAFYFKSLFFTDSLIGYATGYNKNDNGRSIAIKTIDGGKSWILLNLDQLDLRLNSVCFTDKNNGYTVGWYGNIFKTTNGGSSWIKTKTTTTLNCVYFIDSLKGFSAGNAGTLLKTNDGGKNWILVTTGVTNDLYSIFFTDSLTGFVAGSNGRFLKTTDGAKSWTNYISSLGDDFHSIHFTNASIGYATGLSSGVQKTIDGAKTWNQMTTAFPYDTTAQLYSIVFTDSLTGYATGAAGRILKTTNGGLNWYSKTTPGYSFKPLSQFNSVCFAGENKAFTVGNYGKIKKIINSGADIISLNSGTTTIDLNSVYFVNADTGYTVGSQGAILKTTDGGDTWINQPSGSTEYLNATFFTDVNTGYVVGGNGLILKTINGGTSWTSQTSGTSNWLYSVYFTAKDTGYAVGGIPFNGQTEQSIILRTTNGGAAWTKQTNTNPNCLYAVHFSNPNTGYVVSKHGDILKTTDKGITWSQPKKYFGGALYTVFFTDVNTGYTAGQDGTLLTTMNGGIDWQLTPSATENYLNSICFNKNKMGLSVGWYNTITKHNDSYFSQDVKVCKGSSYTFPDGTTKNNITTQTIYTSTLTTVGTGKDSVIVTTVSVNPTYSLTINGSVCYGGNYTFPDGTTQTNIVSPLTHKNNFKSVSGCDSIVTSNLSIINQAKGIDKKNACTSYKWIDSIIYTTSNTTATYTITGGSAKGCDSIVTLNLTINNTKATDVKTACISYKWIDGNTYTADNDTATYTINGGAVFGCDSVVTLNLKIHQPVSTTDVHNTLGSYKWIDGKTYTTNNNTATYTIKGGTVHGCDSTVNLDLTVNYYPADNQSLKLDWANAMGGTAGDIINHISLDSSGNVYSTGYFEKTAHFDSVSGNTNLVSQGLYDIFIEKHDFKGNFIWAKSVGGTGYDSGNEIIVDKAGNTYTTGQFSGTVDFDPGIGVVNITSKGAYDIFILKLSPSGDFLWVKTLGAAGNDWGNSVTQDANDNVYITGVFEQTIDIDPGGPIFNITSKGMRDIFILKLNSDGNYIWSKSLGEAGSDSGDHIKFNGQGDIYISGVFTDSVDFDSGIGTSYLKTSITNGNCFILNIDTAGTFNWCKLIQKSGFSLELDKNNNILITGFYLDTADFDSSNGVSILKANTSKDVSNGYDAFILKLDASANFLWAKSIGSWHDDYAYSAIADDLGNVYVTGSYRQTVDFDPGPKEFYQTAGLNGNLYLQKFDPSGNYLWTKFVYSNHLSDGRTMAIDKYNNIFIGGDFGMTADFDPNSGVKNLTAVGSWDAFVLKLSPCETNDTTITVAAFACYTLNGQKYDSTGTYTQVLVNANGCDSLIVLNLTINKQTITLTDTVCNAYTFHGKTYTASGVYFDTLTTGAGCDSIVKLKLTINKSSFDTIMVTACNSYQSLNGNIYTNSVTYNDTIAKSKGCDSIITVHLTINKANIVADTISACNNYTWPANTYTYTVSGVYTATLTNTTNCDSVVTLNLTINMVDVNVSLTDTSLDAKEIGATYQWLDCNNNFTAINGETNKSYIPSKTGNYAVKLNANGCVDTSICTLITVNCYVHYTTTYDTLQNNFTVTVDSTTSAFANSYYWDFGDGSTSALATPTHTYTIDTVYNVCLKIKTASNDSCSYCSLIGKDYLGNIYRMSGFTINIINPNLLTDQSSILPTENSFVVYPNPNNGSFTVESKTEGTYSIINELGQIIQQIQLNGSNKYSTNIENLNSGIYFIVGFNNEKQTKQKIVVTK